MFAVEKVGRIVQDKQIEMTLQDIHAVNVVSLVTSEASVVQSFVVLHHLEVIRVGSIVVQTLTNEPESMSSELFPMIALYILLSMY